MAEQKLDRAQIQPLSIVLLEQAAALIWLVRKYPDTLKRLESLAASA